jgi:Holliday junction resolvase RusA-like endonuclease
MTSLALTIEGPPLRKNERYEVVALKAKRGAVLRGGKTERATLKNSDEFEVYALRVMQAWRMAGHAPIRSGAWHVDCVAYFKRTRKLDVPVAFGDVDAAVSAALDALQACGAVDDDVRFVTGWLEKHVDSSRPRLELMLRPAGPSPERRMLERIANATDVEHPAPLREMAREALGRS